MGKQEEKTSSTYSLRISENAYQNIDDIAEFIAFINHQLPKTPLHPKTPKSNYSPV